MIRFLALAITALLLAPNAARADTEYLCTGLGLDERAEADAWPHNLRLVYSSRDGHYLGAVSIEVAQAGRVIVKTVCDGPWLIMNVEPGSYTVTSTHEGQTQTTRVRVAPGVRRVEKTIRF